MTARMMMLRNDIPAISHGQRRRSSVSGAVRHDRRIPAGVGDLPTHSALATAPLPQRPCHRTRAAPVTDTPGGATSRFQSAANRQHLVFFMGVSSDAWIVAEG